MTSHRLSRGLSAAITLLVLLVGIPAGLLRFAGNPVAHGIHLDAIWAALSTPDNSGRVLLTVLAVVGWAAWATFAISVLVEIPAQARGVRAPRLHGLGMQQRGAHLLVAALFAMLSLGAGATATAAAAPGTTHAPAATPAAAARMVTDTTAPSAASPVPAITAAGDRHTGTSARRVVVKTGDTLSGIAQTTTGSAANWPQLADASRGTTQPGGQHLDDPDYIQAGWTITVPATVDDAPPAAPHATSTPTPPVAHATTSSSRVRPDPASSTPATAPSSPAPGPARRPATGEGAGQPPVGFLTGTATADEQGPGASDLLLAGTVLGLAGTTAAGVLTLLGRRRSAQSRRRRAGRRIAMPTGDLSDVEAALRGDADPLAADDLDLALRSLAALTRARGQDLPGLRAARITPTALELYLVDDTLHLPDPFLGVGGGVWQIPREGIPGLLDPADAADIPAPYPCLVTLGLDEENSWVLIHLEQIKALTLTGADPDFTQAVLASMTLELIGSGWADDLRVTLVGVLPDLADALGSDRVTHTGDLDHVLAGLTYAAGAHAEALTDAGLADVSQARSRGQCPDAWTPHLLVLAHPPTHEQVQRLHQVLDTVPRLAIAALTTGGDPLTPWALRLATDGTGTLDPAGIQVRPQHLDQATLAALIDTFRVTQDQDLPGPDWAAHAAADPHLDDLPGPGEAIDQTTPDDLEPDRDNTDPGAVTDRPDPENTENDVAELTDIDRGAEATLGDDTHTHPDPSPTEAGEQVRDQVAAHDATHPGLLTPSPWAGTVPLLRLLGDVEIQRATGKRPQAPRRATELIAFLALHPGDSYEPLDAALWPGQRVTAAKRNGPVNQARTWLGTAADGHPWVSLVPEHGYRLAPDTACDWTRFLALIGPDLAATSTAHLTAALGLVAGQPLTVRSGRGTWAWAEPDRQEMIAAIADVAHQLSVRALHSGDATTAEWAAAKGLMVEPSSEQLWRDQLRAAWLSAVPGRVDTIAGHLSDTLEPIAGDLEEETLDLLDDLLNRRRRNVS